MELVAMYDERSPERRRSDSRGEELIGVDWLLTQVTQEMGVRLGADG